MRFRILLEKYSFLKTFKSNKDYDDYGVDEISLLLSVHQRINEVQSQCMDLNNPKK